MSNRAVDPDRAIAAQKRLLEEAFGDQVDRPTIDRQFRAALDPLAGARVRTDVPLLAYRIAHTRLSALTAPAPDWAD